MLPPEDSYGLTKRLEFVIAEIKRRNPRRVLDFGCGTGANLTAPLAERFPEIQFVGVDSDATSIIFARETYANRNLEFRLYPQEFSFGEDFDLLIASEVLEHIEQPDVFLARLRGSLAKGGALLVTIPNGFGPFELASLVEAVLHVTGLYNILRKLRHFISATSADPASVNDTLAISPHVNFFSFGEFVRLFASQGFVQARYQGRTFLCGFGFDLLLRGDSVLRWNAQIANRLPPQIVSDWMVVLEPNETPRQASFRRSAYARLRRWLSYRRYNQRTPITTR